MVLVPTEIQTENFQNITETLYTLNHFLLGKNLSKRHKSLVGSSYRLLIKVFLKLISHKSKSKQLSSVWYRSIKPNFIGISQICWAF
jgi:hypothetical protein